MYFLTCDSRRVRPRGGTLTFVRRTQTDTHTKSVESLRSSSIPSSSNNLVQLEPCAQGGTGPMTMRQGQIHKYLSFGAVLLVDGFRSNTLGPSPARIPPSKSKIIRFAEETTVEIFVDESKPAPSPGAEDRSRRRALQRVASGWYRLYWAAKRSRWGSDTGLMQKEELEIDDYKSKVDSTTTLISRKPSARRLTTDEESRIEIFERVAPSVVYIDTFSDRRVSEFSTNTLEVPIGSGSGFVWDREGHIVTNFHVVQQAKAAQVTVLTPAGDNRRYDQPTLQRVPAQFCQTS